MKLQEWSKFVLLASIVLLSVSVGALLRYTTFGAKPCDCATASAKQQLYFHAPKGRGGTPAFVVASPRTDPPPYPSSRQNSRNGKKIASHRNLSNQSPRVEGKSNRPRLLSYQPPGNGWNNQRIALENALVLAKLLNRTLVLHPLSPHELGIKLKAGKRPGYVTYNMINATDLLPPAAFMNLELMSRLLPVTAVNSSHPQFLREFGRLSWKNVCHSTGFGYWVDRPPEMHAEVALLSRQKFTPIKIWRERCSDEQERARNDPSPIVRFVSDLEEETAQMLYFEQGTLFGMHIRFTTLATALKAQRWVLDYVEYGALVWERVNRIIKRMGGEFNAIQVRRTNHMDSKLNGSFWLDRMASKKFTSDVPLYVATDRFNKNWFNPFKDSGFKIFTANDFTDVLDFSNVAASLRNDYLGIHEQCICERAELFVPSPASTFAAWILRRRREVRFRDGLMMDTLHTYWIGHQVKDK